RNHNGGFAGHWQSVLTLAKNPVPVQQKLAQVFKANEGTDYASFCYHVARKDVARIHQQGNDKAARQIEAAHRTSLAKGEEGIRERKPSPTLKEFIDKRFEAWARRRSRNPLRKLG